MNAVIYAGTPHVFYADCAGNLRQAWWNGAAWQYQTLDTNLGQPGGLSAVVYGQQLHLFYEKVMPTFADADWVEHAWWDGARWNYEQFADYFGNPVGTSISAIAYSDQLHVLFSGPNDHGLHDKWWDGSRWRETSLDWQNVSDVTTMVWGSTLQVFYGGYDATGTGCLPATTLEPCASLAHAWLAGGVWHFDVIRGPYSADDGMAALVFQGVPHVFSLSNVTGLHHCWWSSSGWQCEDVNGISSSDGHGLSAVGLMDGMCVYLRINGDLQSVCGVTYSWLTTQITHHNFWTAVEGDYSSYVLWGGQPQVYFHGDNGGLEEAYYTSAAPTPTPTPTPSPKPTPTPTPTPPPQTWAAAGPSVGVWPNSPGQQDVFWKGADGNLWEGYWNNGWHGPYNIRNTLTGRQMGPLGSEPTVVANPVRCEDDVFWQGTDGNLWEAYWSCASGWNGPSKVGPGSLGSQPAVVAWPNSPGEQDVFWKGTDGNLWEEVWNNGWHGPYDIRSTQTGSQMGPLGSAPTAVANPGRCENDVFWTGMDGRLWEATWSCSAGWLGPSPVGVGPLASQPAVAVWPNSPGEQDVFWKGTDGNLWEEIWNNGWHGPYDIRNTRTGSQMGPLGSAPTAVVNAARCEDDVFWKGTDGNVWEAYWSCTSGWNGPSKVGMGPLG